MGIHGIVMKRIFAGLRGVKTTLEKVVQEYNKLNDDSKFIILSKFGYGESYFKISGICRKDEQQVAFICEKFKVDCQLD